MRLPLLKISTPFIFSFGFAPLNVELKIVILTFSFANLLAVSIATRSAPPAAGFFMSLQESQRIL